MTESDNDQVIGLKQALRFAHLLSEIRSILNLSVHDDPCCTFDEIPKILSERLNSLPGTLQPSERPVDQSGQGRFLLNQYGRQCYDLGYEAATKEPVRRVLRRILDSTEGISILDLDTAEALLTSKDRQ